MCWILILNALLSPPPPTPNISNDKKKKKFCSWRPPKHMYTPGLERSHWPNEQHFARQMSFVLCRPSWEPKAFHLTFRSLRYFWSLSVTGTWASKNTFPKNPQVFMRVSVEGDRALRQPQEHPGARGPCAPWPGSRLSAGSGVGGRGSQPRSVPPARTQWPGTRDGLAATSSRLQDTPLATVDTQACLKPVAPNGSMQHCGWPTPGLSREAAEVKKPF